MQLPLNIPGLFLLLRFWESHLWDNCTIYPEYFFPPHFLRACSYRSSASTPAPGLSIFLECWLVRKGPKGDNCTLFSRNYKISSAYKKWCSQQAVWVFLIRGHVNSLCSSVYLQLASSSEAGFKFCSKIAVNCSDRKFETYVTTQNK